MACCLIGAKSSSEIWTSAAVLLIRHLGTNFSEVLIAFHTFSFKKMHLKMSPGKWRPFCLGLNVLYSDIHILRVSCQKGPTRHAYAWQIGPFWQDTLDIYQPCWNQCQLVAKRKNKTRLICIDDWSSNILNWFEIYMSIYLGKYVLILTGQCIVLQGTPVCKQSVALIPQYGT